jgi:hypothetical protein
MKALIAICGMVLLEIMARYVERRWEPIDQLAFYTAEWELLTHRWTFNQ